MVFNKMDTVYRFSEGVFEKCRAEMYSSCSKRPAAVYNHYNKPSVPDVTKFV